VTLASSAGAVRGRDCPGWGLGGAEKHGEDEQKAFSRRP